MHSDVNNLEVLEKLASVPNYALLIVALYSSKVYVYPMPSGKKIHNKLEKFYIDVQNKRKNRHTRLQVDNEFQQVEIENLNDTFNVTMFATSLRGGKTFAAEHKIRQLKRILKLRVVSDNQKAKVPVVTIIKQSIENKNNIKSEKYGINPNVIKEKSLPSQRFRTLI